MEDAVIKEEYLNYHLLSKYGADKYEEIRQVVSEACSKAVEEVAALNEDYKRKLIEKLVAERKASLPQLKKLDLREDPPSPSPSKKKKRRKDTNPNVEPAAQEQYREWQREKVGSRAVVLSAQRLLALQEKLLRDEKVNFYKCTHRQTSPQTYFWDSAHVIFQMIRTCILTRNWNNLTHLLLILINRNNSKEHLPFIRTICQEIAAHNPQVKDSDLGEKFDEILRQRKID